MFNWVTTSIIRPHLWLMQLVGMSFAAGAARDRVAWNHPQAARRWRTDTLPLQTQPRNRLRAPHFPLAILAAQAVPLRPRETEAICQR